MRTSVQLTLLAVAALIGAACPGPDDTDPVENTDLFAFTVRGANVLPQPADTLPAASGTFNSATLAWTISISPAPTGVIDSIGIYQLAASATNCVATPTPTCSSSGNTTLPGSANSYAAVMLCGAPAAACAATPASGTGALVGAATNASVKNLLRGYGGQLIVFTQTVRTAGVMRGTPYPTPNP